MNYALIALLVVVAGGLLIWWLQRKPSATPSRTAGRPAPSPAPQVSAPAAASAGPASAPAPELALEDERLLPVASLPEARRQAMLQELRTIPRPPSALQQLVSPAFLARASSSELAELVMAEPVVTAKVLAAVNSPLYGLHKSVNSVGQAITFLGLNSVRSLALQYLLNESLPADDPRLRREFDTLWKTSAIATELCLHLSKRLQLLDAASMATQLVLSYLGRLAATVLALRGGDAGAALLSGGGTKQARVLDVQQRLGLSSGEIGYLLMTEWGLPEPLAAATRGIGRLPFAAAPAADPAYAARLAVCALSAILAERLARGELQDLLAYDLARDDSEDVQAVRRHLPPALLEQVALGLQAPELERLASKA